MKLILAEKPSVALDIAKALGSYEKHKDHIRAGGYVITWAYGHLLEIDGSIAEGRWSIEGLPIFPQEFFYKVINKHFWAVKRLIEKASEVIIATDAGREGELIARLILIHSGWRNWSKTYRFWTSQALTEQVVRSVLRNLRPAWEFDSLYWCALARQHADWIVGINLTRLVSCLANDQKVWSVGRVQTPTLALVVQRTIERENFKPQPYYVLRAVFSKDGKTYTGNLILADVKDEEQEGDEPFRLSYEKAKEIFSLLEKERFGVVQEVKKTKKRVPPPRLFSLTSLQRRANELFGWSASKTLDIAQRLYEDYKCISYPRTDAEYLSSANKELVKEVLRKLSASHLIERVDLVGLRVFNDSKLTDHHAIIVLDKLPPSAREDERKLYELIKNRFLAVFMPDYVYLSYKVITRVGKYRFLSTGRKDLELGFRQVEPSDERFQDLSFLEENDKVKVEKLLLDKRLTQPPPAYTEGSLLKEMERLGLGTPATRAKIIDTLKERGYVFLNKKSLIASEKGKALIRFLGSSAIKDWELTSQWEQKLEQIYTRKLSKKGYEDFIQGIKAFVEEEINKLKRLDANGLKDYNNKGRVKKLRDQKVPCQIVKRIRKASPRRSL